MPKGPTKTAFTVTSPYVGATFKAHRGLLWKSLRAAGVMTDVNRPTISSAGPAQLADVDAVSPEVGLLFFDASANSIARTLQSSGAASEETVITAVRTDSNPANTVTLSANGSDTINGAASIAVPVGAVLVLQLPAGATNWRLISVGGSQAGMREALNVPAFNWLDNPDGAVYQRTPAATADDNYGADRWNILTQTGTVTPSQLNNPEDGYRNGLRITQSQAVAQRFGDSQILDGRSTAQLRGKVVTAGGRFRMSAAGNVRLAILAWTGTEDAVTSDVVSNWASGVYTAGNFFNSTTLTVVATNSKTLAAATIDSASVSGTVPANATNLIYFFFTEATQAQNVTLDRWGQRVVEAASLVEHVRRDYLTEFLRCRWYYRVYVGLRVIGYSNGTNAIGAPLAWEMRATPSNVFNITSSGNVNTGASNVQPASSTAGVAFISPSAAGNVDCTFTLSLSADL